MYEPSIRAGIDYFIAPTAVLTSWAGWFGLIPPVIASIAGLFAIAWYSIQIYDRFNNKNDG